MPCDAEHCRLADCPCGVKAPVDRVPWVTKAYRNDAPGIKQPQPQQHAAQVGCQNLDGCSEPCEAHAALSLL